MGETLTARGHRHAEAFCLMTYASRDFAYCERIWNSRDGVTPFTIRSRDGMVEMQHVDWTNDTYLPEHTPRPGDRIFVDLSPQIARQRARERVERYWDDPSFPVSRMFATKEEAFASLGTFNPGEPMLIVVTPDG